MVQAGQGDEHDELPTSEPEHTHTHELSSQQDQCLLTVVGNRGELVAIGTDTESTVLTGPVKIKQCSFTSITQLSYSLHCTLPQWNNYTRIIMYKSKSDKKPSPSPFGIQ